MPPTAIADQIAPPSIAAQAPPPGVVASRRLLPLMFVAYFITRRG